MKERNKRIFTIPNMLSLLRLLMIPLLMWLYLEKQHYGWTILVLILSGATDVLDGIIARKFNMISDLGKALDPVADKLTQIAVMFCLTTRFPHLLALLALLVVKEIINAVTSLMAIRKTGKVYGAVWHGKLTTVMLYTVMGIHIVWYNIPKAASISLAVLCAAVMVYSMVSYWKRNRKMIRGEEPC